MTRRNVLPVAGQINVAPFLPVQDPVARFAIGPVVLAPATEAFWPAANPAVGEVTANVRPIDCQTLLDAQGEGPPPGLVNAQAVRGYVLEVFLWCAEPRVIGMDVWCGDSNAVGFGLVPMLRRTAFGGSLSPPEDSAWTFRCLVPSSLVSVRLRNYENAGGGLNATIHGSLLIRPHYGGVGDVSPLGSGWNVGGLSEFEGPIVTNAGIGQTVYLNPIWKADECSSPGWEPPQAAATARGNYYLLPVHSGRLHLYAAATAACTFTILGSNARTLADPYNLAAWTTLHAYALGAVATPAWLDTNVRQNAFNAAGTAGTYVMGEQGYGAPTRYVALALTGLVAPTVLTVYARWAGR
jgi:hypothetical protein